MYKSNVFFILIIFLFEVKSQTYFDEISSKFNIKVSHSNNSSDKFHFTETTGSGIAWFDIDNDNDQDLLVINSTPNNAITLYKNEKGVFTKLKGAVKTSMSNSINMGICAADINSDYFIDFVVTGYGENKFFINKSGKYFEENILESNTPNSWGTGCTITDLDNDRDLDLYITQYVNYTHNGNQSCVLDKQRGYCSPKAYQGLSDLIYENVNGQLRLKNIDFGFSSKNERGYAVASKDFNNDSLMDLYIANDGSANRLLINQGDFKFDDIGLNSGLALNWLGQAEASMGLIISDFNNDKKEEIFLTHFSLESNTYYEPLDKLKYIDTTNKKQLNRNSYLQMGWGVVSKDFNLDGWNDILIANGHFHDFVQELDSRQTFNQSNQLYLNQEGRHFELSKPKTTFDTNSTYSSRSLATADINNDGLIDFAVSNINAPLQVFKNSIAHNNNWIGIHLIGEKPNTSAIGALIKLTAGKNHQYRTVSSSEGFLSHSDLRVVFGLKKSVEKVRVEVTWPNMKKNIFHIKSLNKYHALKYTLQP